LKKSTPKTTYLLLVARGNKFKLLAISTLDFSLKKRD
jgi:hypothetical protein